MCWGIDMFFKNNYGAVIKNHCSGILSCSCKTRKSIKYRHQLAEKNNFLAKHLLVAASYLLIDFFGCFQVFIAKNGACQYSTPVRQNRLAFHIFLLRLLKIFLNYLFEFIVFIEANDSGTE